MSNTEENKSDINNLKDNLIIEREELKEFR